MKTATLVDLEEPVSGKLYVELKRLIEEKGFLKRQYPYYAFKITLALMMLALGVIVLVEVQNVWVRLLDAVYLGFVAVQLGFIGHDAGHRQIFATPWKNDIIGLMNVFFVGASYFWWMDTHNRHHSKPNQESYDPAINYTLLAFSNEQARSKTGITRFFVRYQTFFFIPFLVLYPISMRIDSFKFLLQRKSKHGLLEGVLLIFHFLVYFWLLFSLLEIWQAVLFIIIHQSLFGLYLSSVFVPNHMGRVIWDESAELDFLTQQVITARNVKGHPLIDFWYGGLNYQIEHHLFPKMARNKLRHAREVVQAFLKERSIEYYETGFLQSYKEIFQNLHRVSTLSF